jgi:hypothetical protein
VRDSLVGSEEADMGLLQRALQLQPRRILHPLLPNHGLFEGLPLALFDMRLY